MSVINLSQTYIVLAYNTSGVVNRLIHLLYAALRNYAIVIPSVH